MHPQVSGYLTEKDADKVREGIIQLANVCGGFEHTAYTDEFIRACALVAQPRAYELKGADPYIIDNEVIMMNEESKTYFERLSEKAERQGFEKAIRIYMQRTGATEEEARRIFGTSSSDADTGVSDMDLPDLKR